MLLRRPDHGLLLLLALYDEQIDERTGEHRTGCTLLTIKAGARSARLTDRLPVATTVDAPAVALWLAPSPVEGFSADPLLGLLVAAPTDLVVADELNQAAARPDLAPLRLPRRPPRANNAEAPPGAGNPSPVRRAPEQLRLF